MSKNQHCGKCRRYDSVVTDCLNAHRATIDYAKISQADVDNLTVKSEVVTSLTAQTANITNATLGEASADLLVAKKAIVEQLEVTNVNVKNVNVDTANVNTANITTANVTTDNVKELVAENGTITNLDVTEKLNLPNLPQDPSPVPPAGTIWFNTTTNTLNFSDGTSIQVISTAPQVDFINRNNLTITPRATLEVVDNSIPEDFPGDQDPTIFLEMPDAPNGQVKLFLLTTVGTPETSADVQISGSGISLTLSTNGPNGVQTASFVFGGPENGWINYATSTPVAQIPSFYEPITPESSSMRLPVGKKVEEAKGKKLEETKGKKVEEAKGKKVEEAKGKKVEETKGKKVEEAKGKKVETKKVIKSGHGLKAGPVNVNANCKQTGFSIAISLDAQYMAVGAPKSSAGNITGQVIIFKLDPNGNYVQQQVLRPLDDTDAGNYGYSVTLNNDGSVLAVGAPIGKAGPFNFNGLVYAYTRSGEVWNLQDRIVEGVNGVGFFGSSISMDASGIAIVIGARLSNNPDGVNTGNAYVFANINGKWGNPAKLTLPAGTGPGNLFGASVNMVQDASTIAVGIPNYQGTGIGAVAVYSNSDPTYPSSVIFPQLPSLSLNSLGYRSKSMFANVGMDKTGKLKTSKSYPKMLSLASLGTDVINDTTANNGNVIFDGDNFVRTAYQLPTSGSKGPTYVYTSKGNLPFPQMNMVEDPVFVNKTNVGGFWAIPAQPRFSINANVKLAYNPIDKNLYLVYTDANDPNVDVGALTMAVNMVKSTDGGNTWVATTSPRNLGKNSVFFSNMAIDPITGAIAVSWYDCANSPTNTEYEVMVAISNDGGNTWGSTLNLSSGIGRNSNSIHDNGNDAGSYMGIDFYNNVLVVSWANNSDGLTPPNPNQGLGQKYMVLGVGILSVSGNVGVVQKVVNASGSHVGHHTESSVAINRSNNSNITISCNIQNQVETDPQTGVYYVTTTNSGNTWNGFFAFTTETSFPTAVGNTKLISTNAGVLYFSYLTTSTDAAVIASSASFGSDPNDFILAANLTSDPTRTINLPVIGYTNFQGNDYFAEVWQDATQGYTFSAAPLPPAIPTGMAGGVRAQGGKKLDPKSWSRFMKCPPPSENPAVLMERLTADQPTISSIADFGRSVSMNANTLVVGAPGTMFKPANGESVSRMVGATFVFSGQGLNWNQFGPPLIGDNYVNDPAQGQSVAISNDGNTLMIGGYNDGVQAGVGASWKFTRSDDTLTYIQQGSSLRFTTTANAQQGSAIAMSGDGAYVAIGAPGDKNGQGSVYNL